MKEEDKSKLVEVFSGALWEAELLTSMLKDNGIRAVTKDSAVVNIVLPTTNIDVAVLVNECDFIAAMRVVDAYIKNEEK